jgi:hypothetical protein
MERKKKQTRPDKEEGLQADWAGRLKTLFQGVGQGDQESDVLCQCFVWGNRRDERQAGMEKQEERDYEIKRKNKTAFQVALCLSRLSSTHSDARELDATVTGSSKMRRDGREKEKRKAKKKETRKDSRQKDRQGIRLTA